MTDSPEVVRGGETSPLNLAHIEDSLAPAEHLVPADLEQRLERFSQRDMKPGNLLERAWTYNEYALATPEFKRDDKLFRFGRADLEAVIASGLGPRHPIRFGAHMLLHYEEIFRRRASLHNVPNKARRNLQRNLGRIRIHTHEVYITAPFNISSNTCAIVS